MTSALRSTSTGSSGSTGHLHLNTSGVKVCTRTAIWRMCHFWGKPINDVQMDGAEREKTSPHVTSWVIGRKDESTSATDEYHSLFKSTQTSAAISHTSTSSQFRILTSKCSVHVLFSSSFAVFFIFIFYLIFLNKILGSYCTLHCYAQLANLLFLWSFSIVTVTFKDI